MPVFSKETWKELLQNTTLDLVKALEKDGYIEDEHESDQRVYVKHGIKSRRVSLSWSNPGENCKRKMLGGVIDDTGWLLDDLRRLGLIRQSSGY